ncbi:MAG TPA: hydrogenase/urease maturation nickel metallochaperone HypA [Candidatus Limnocylindrales bacterium]|nr:hydrogenase/urease maturation nickel metallochaperone HypA [Candidatus Limnocylindrales bacterium]
MHEAGLAAEIAVRLQEGRRTGRAGRPRVLVRGGHDASADFDASLRFHLALVAPGLSAGLEIVHLPVARLCASCGRGFEDAEVFATCPSCGGAALPVSTGEEAVVEWSPEMAG